MSEIAASELTVSYDARLCDESSYPRRQLEKINSKPSPAATPTLTNLHKERIVLVREGASLDDVISHLHPETVVTHVYESINGFCGDLHDDDMKSLQVNPDIEEVGGDAIVRLCDEKDK